MTTTVYMIGSYIWKLSLVLLDYLSIIDTNNKVLARKFSTWSPTAEQIAAL